MKIIKMNNLTSMIVHLLLPILGGEVEVGQPFAVMVEVESMTAEIIILDKNIQRRIYIMNLNSTIQINEY